MPQARGQWVAGKNEKKKTKKEKKKRKPTRKKKKKENKTRGQCIGCVGMKQTQSEVCTNDMTKEEQERGQRGKGRGGGRM